MPVHVTSLPSGATVKIDSQTVGLTPLDHFVRPGKPFTVCWEKKGYERVERQVTRLAPEDLLKIRASLKRAAMLLQLKPAILPRPSCWAGSFTCSTARCSPPSTR